MKYFITGTHAYGPVTKGSDLDIVVLKQDAKNIEQFINKHFIPIHQTDIQLSYKNGGFYFNIGFIKVNIIIAEDQKEFDLWYKRTERMKQYEPIKSREERIAFFNEKEDNNGIN